MASMVSGLFNNIYKNKTVLLTGHTGFKGSWMAYWLQELGANVIGYSLSPNTIPNHFEALKLNCHSYIENIADLNKLREVFKEQCPDIVFHLAAQSLVRYSYQNPIETYQTNILGTANVLECIRNFANVKAIVIITSDKCYENFEVNRGYVESDRMGGYDPYSSSKGCAELVTNAYRNSYFNNGDFGIKHNTLVASGRAGNVIGGGDWSLDRLIPDLIKGVIRKEATIIRSPASTRPWQHVLEPISGYLLLGQKLLEGNVAFAEGWNFGPAEQEVLTVEEVLKIAVKYWGDIQYKTVADPATVKEAKSLSLNCEKANKQLQWYPVWSNELSIAKTIQWYHDFYSKNHVSTLENLEEFISSAKIKKTIWTV